jgi:uncharacterized protein with PQ loop repeat
MVFETMGMIGITLSAAAYLPQLTHLVRRHCADGISTRAWTMWLTSSLLIGSLALYRHDYVFIVLAASTAASSATILVLAHRYKDQACDPHEPRHHHRVATVATVLKDER